LYKTYIIHNFQLFRLLLNILKNFKIHEIKFKLLKIKYI